MAKIKEYKIQSVLSVQELPRPEIPGITIPKINYGTSVGGKDAPADGATKNTGALADLNSVDTAQIVAGAVTKVKMALLSVDADIIAANAITENKLYTGAVTADKISSNAVTSAKIMAGAIVAGKIAAGAVTATEINVATLSAITANIGTVTAGNINGVTITGGTVRTASSGARCVLDGGNNIISVFDSSGIERMRMTQQNLNFINSGGNIIGQVYSGSDSNLNVSVPNGGYLILNAAGSSYAIDMQNAGNSIANVNSNGLSMTSGKRITIPQSSGTATPLTVGSYSFRPVGFSYTLSGVNHSLIVLATGDPT